jgi:hypothetical protein
MDPINKEVETWIHIYILNSTEFLKSKQGKK